MLLDVEATVTADLNALFLEYRDWIKRMAKRLNARFPSVAADDLQQAGAHGLVKGMEVYEDDGSVREPARHRRAFFHKWIRGEMLMHLRQDVAQHRYVREARDAVRQTVDESGDAGTEAGPDVRTHTTGGIFELAETLALGVYTRRTPEDEMMRQETLASIDLFYSELDEQEREFVRLRFVEELTLEEVGLALGYSSASARSSMSRMEKRICTQARHFLPH